MFKEDVILLIKYICVFLFLIFSPVILYFIVSYGEKNIFVFGALTMYLNAIICLIVPYIEIKLCQRIASKHADTVLIKLLSTYNVPIFILLFLICLDIVLPLLFIKTNDWLSHALLFYTGGVSFSGSFLPAFIMSIDYKNVMTKNLPEFYDESTNYITVTAITIVTFCFKMIGFGVFLPLKTYLHNLFVQ